jgi:hypothetical protein
MNSPSLSTPGTVPTQRAILSPQSSRTLLVMAWCGLLILVLGSSFSPLRVWSNLLVVTYYLITLALGGCLFLALTYVAGAGWNVAFRRIPEAMATLMVPTGIAILLVLALRMNHYGWQLHESAPAGTDAGTFWFKQFWLSPPFWIARSGIYVLLWSILATGLVAISRRQDHADPRDSTSNLRYTKRCVRLAALFIVVYAITFSLASVDWIMALEPMWFSTMWGVYHFAGMIQATLAAIIVVGLLLRRPGKPLHGIFRDDHLHDLGKLLLGFSCFWMYIWFSQYMLIWYANIPEETTYFIARMHGPWGPVVVISVLLNWLIPFFVLLPKPSKRSSRVMMKVAVVVLIGRWVDLTVMIFPPVVGALPVLGVWEISGACCLIGTFGLLCFKGLTKSASAPINDPFYEESLNYHSG